MAQKPDGKSARTERVTFTRPAAERIAKVVRAVEGGDRDTPGIYFGSAPGAAPGKTFRVCTFTGAWAKGDTKVLTFQNVTTTPNTVSALNQLFHIGDACNTQVAYIGKVGTTWHLLNVQHHETAVIVNVTLTTAALEFTRRLTWIPYPGETATISIPLSTDTSCSS